MTLEHPFNTTLQAAGRGLAAALLIAAGGSLVTPEAAAQAAAPEVRPTDPETVVRALTDAMKANDGARIRALFAPGASQAYGDGKPKSGPAFFAWLESDIIERKGRVEEPQFAVNGNEVIVTGQFRNSRGYRSAANFRIVVDQARIVSWQMRY
ncbi:MAG TPA: nuclear transport factor 2 family protein [Burkholderiaceae bacterium]